MRRFILGNVLCGTVNLAKYAYKNEYKYSGYGVGFNNNGIFPESIGRFGKNIIIFGADMNSVVHVNMSPTRENILILGKRPTNRSDDTTLTAEKEHLINFYRA